MKKVILLFLGVFFCVLPGFAFSYTYEGQTLYYSTNGGNTCIVDDFNHHINIKGELVIPAEANGYAVVGIESSAFENCKYLTSITIPGSVTTIGNYVFNGCESLCKVIIEDGEETLYMGYNTYTTDEELEAGKGLFYDCPLETLYLGRNLSYETDRHYGYSPFIYTSSLSDLTISNFVTSIGNYAFWFCSRLTSVQIPNSVTSIGDYAFYGCSSLTSVEVPNSLTSIGNYAFSGCSSLTSVEIPNSVTSIGDGAFYGCIGLTSVEIPNSVTSIGNYAFWFCIGLTSVEIPNSVTSIGNYAFEFCSGLTSVQIPNSVTSIGKEAFYDCMKIRTVELPKSVEYIGSNAFNSLIKLTCLSGIPPRTDGKPVNSDCEVIVPAGSFNEYMLSPLFYSCIREEEGIMSANMSDGNFEYKLNPSDKTAWVVGAGSYKDIMIPYSVSGGGDEKYEVIGIAYSGLLDSEIETVRFQSKSTLKYVGANAFPKSLRTIKLPETVRRIDSKAFAGSQIESISLPNSLTQLGDQAFNGCSKLQKITFGNGLKAIPSYAFLGTKVSKIILPPVVETIGYAAFANNSNIEYIAMGSNMKTVGNYAFNQSRASALYITAPTPPDAADDTFGSYIGDLYVQGSEAVDEYADFNVCWWRFSNFYPMSVPEALKVTGDTRFVGSKGDTFQLTAKLEPADVALPYVFWRSTNPDVATVDANGLVTLRTDVSADMETEYGCKIIAETLYHDVASAEFTVTNGPESGINDVTADYIPDNNALVEVYNLNGIRVADSTDHLSPGLYIVRQGSTVRKVFIK